MATAVPPILDDRYTELELAARGGMAEVWRGWDTRLARDVAIKVLDTRFSEDEDFRRRIEREARTAAAISGHPHVVTVYDVGEWDGRPFIVMQHARGGSIAERMRAARQPRQRSLDWLAQAASALDHAHHEGIVHRDVKPGNLLLDDRDEVLVSDFGIAMVTDDALTQLTRTGELLGTPGYVAPEQAEGAAASEASDRYSFGVVAFELLTGRRPFQRATAMAEIVAHLHEAVPAATSVDPGLPSAVDPVFERALAKAPQERYESATRMVLALEDALGLAPAPATVLLAPAPPTARIATRTVPAVARSGGREPARTSSAGRPRRTSIARAAAFDRSRWGSLALLMAVVILLVGSVVLAARSDERSSGEVPVPPAVRAQNDEAEGDRSAQRSAQRNAPESRTERTASSGDDARPERLTAAEAAALNDRAWRLMQQGRHADAVPLLERALPALAGVHPTEAYAEFNLGQSLLRTGECNGVREHLERSRRLQGERTQITSALREYDAQCASEADGGDGDSEHDREDESRDGKDPSD